MVEQTDAADLPGGSVVADDIRGVAYYAISSLGEGDDYRWVETGQPVADSTVDYHLRDGAVVVRVGESYTPTPTLPPDARDRLARHLYLQANTNQQGRAAGLWDRNHPKAERDAWLTRADVLLAVINGKEG